MPETAREEAEALAKEIADAVKDYRRSFPEPYALSPNLGLAVRALALLSVPETENWEYGVEPLSGFDPDEGLEMPSRERAESYASGFYDRKVVRRRPAGPWEPVPVEEDNP